METTQVGKLKIKIKKLFLNRKVRISKEMLDYYYNQMKSKILNREIPISLSQNSLEINNELYKIVGLFNPEQGTFLVYNEKAESFYEIKDSAIYESFGIRKYVDGKIYIPKQSDFQLNLKTLKRVEEESQEIEEDEETFE